MNSDALLTRFEFDGRVEHRRGQQFVSGRGFAGDRFEQVHRIEPHGFASVPVKGGIATILQSGGNRDSAYVFGGENPAMRPDLPPGASAIYDGQGNIIKLIGTGAVFDFGSRTATLTAGEWTIEGDVTIKGNLTVEGDVIASGSVTDGDGDGGA